jgi:hypothetical protein
MQEGGPETRKEQKQEHEWNEGGKTHQNGSSINRLCA